ncbi:hypothetical protein LTR95_006633, partial [Oleoguttula sp. CCFEE 5521]
MSDSMASFTISDVRIFDGEHTIPCGTVTVEQGKIASVKATSSSTTPTHTLLPGLIDCHVHCNSAAPSALPQSLRFGVTTVCDMHNEYPNIVTLRKQIEEEGDCADLKTTSFGATVENGWPGPVVLAHSKDPHVLAEVATWPRLKTEQDAKDYIRDRISEGVDYIKLMHESGTVMGAKFNMPSLELQKAVIDEAHANNLIAVAHATCRKDTLDILGVGVDGLTHQFTDKPPDQEVINAYLKNNAHLNPTLAAMGSLTTEGKALQEQFAHDPGIQHLLPENARNNMCSCMDFAKLPGCTVDNAYETVRQLKAAGVDVVVGSDAAGPAVGTAWGLSVHQELHLLVHKCGFTPVEALKAATSINARRFRFHDRGRIQPGMRADLVLIEGNPLEDIGETLNLRSVWTKGLKC